MDRTQLATVALLITVLAVPVATAQTGPATTAETPEANGTEPTATTTATTASTSSPTTSSTPTRTPTATPTSSATSTEISSTTSSTSTATATPTTGPVERVETAVPTAPGAPTATDRERETDTPGSNTRERVDSDLILLNSSYDGDAAGGSDRGVVTLTFRAESPQAVTLVDAGAFSLGGQLPSRTLSPWSGRATFKFTVYEPPESNFVGVTIVTEEAMYAEPVRIEPGGPDLPQISTMLAVLMGISAVVVAMLLLDRHLDVVDSEGVHRVE